MNLMFKEKMNKAKFEERLISIFGHSQLSSCPYEEEGNEPGKFTKMTLYYHANKHVGTWCKGEGWVFKQES